MDGLDDTGPNNGGGAEEADPAAEFLAREQSNLAGLEDDIPPAAVVTNGISERSGSPSDMGRSSPSAMCGSPGQEPEKIRIWREEQKERLEIKGYTEFSIHVIWW